MNAIIRLGQIISILSISTISGFSQTNIQFTAIAANDEQAIRLNWSSISNEVYEIDEADSLIDTNTGTITWNLLYNNYPSQGTNTFWLDTGNYDLSPEIIHPKYSPMRFYRIVDRGADTTSDEPTVVITSPTNSTSSTGELTVTVAATTDQPILNGTKLYVDGQEMRPALLTTNYTDTTGVTNYEIDTYYLNTCEWGNEVHTLFATAEAESGNGDAVNSGAVASGHGVSPFVNVLFSNLVTRISFSEPSFDPTVGETQQVTAVFAANCNWTLNIEDINSNVVQTATGSGSTLSYDWDGTGMGGTNLPAGVYYYYISAETNGGVYNLSSGGSESGTNYGIPPLPESETMVYAMSDGGSSSVPVPLELYPPGFDTNGFTLFESSPAEISALYAPAVSRETSSSFIGGEATPDFSGGGSSASSQDTPASPQRKPMNPVEGVSGLYGIAWDTYSANGTNAMSAYPIPNEPGITGSYISLDTFPSNAHLTYAPVPQFNSEAGNFESTMTTYGWNHTIVKTDGNLSINDLTGNGTPFNNVSLGVLLTHGAYGSTMDYNAGLVKTMYFPITSGGNIQYLRMTDMNLGGSDPTNGLKWFVYMSCDSLHQANWTSMKNGGHVPYNNNLHMILGANSVISSSPTILQNWAQYMNFGYTNDTPMTIHDAWYLAAHNAYHGHTYTNTMYMAVASDTACTGDYIEKGFNSPPGGTWSYESQQVWP